MDGERLVTYLGQLALEDVNLAEEHNARRAKEPPRVDDALEEDERLRHPILQYEELIDDR